MLTVKVLGPGCANCKRMEQTVQRVIADLGVQADVRKVTDYADIMAYNILATPGLVINERLVCAGRIPTPGEVARWLTTAAG